MTKEDRIEEAKKLTQDHRDLVEKYMKDFASTLEIRGYQHDFSKTQEPEFTAFMENTERLKSLTYGSDEYRQALKDLGPALKHHYEYEFNRHHPENHSDGIDGMTLLDLLEMYCDWLAATKRHADGDIVKSIKHNKKRFAMSDQLARIFQNTLERYHPREIKDAEQEGAPKL